MNKIITEKKCEKKIFDFDEGEYANLKYSSPKTIAEDMSTFLIATNGVCSIKMNREPNNIKTFFKVAKFLKEEISKYELENNDGKLTVFFDLPVNKKPKVTNENYFLPHKKDPGRNVISFRLGVKGSEKLDELEDFTFIDNEKLEVVRVCSDTKENTKNCGQIASFAIRSLVKDGADIVLSFITSDIKSALDVKTYGSLVILERMAKEDLGMICGGYDKIPQAYLKKHIKVFGEIELDTEELVSSRSLTKIKLYLTLKNGVKAGAR